MPSTIVIRYSRNEGGPAIKHIPTFLQWLYSPHMIDGDSDDAIADVIFIACKAKLPAYTGERIGIEGVIMGSGSICDKETKPQPTNIGDLSYAPPGTTYWYAAGNEPAARHLAIDLAGTTQFNIITF